MYKSNKRTDNKYNNNIYIYYFLVQFFFIHKSQTPEIPVRNFLYNIKYFTPLCTYTIFVYIYHSVHDSFKQLLRDYWV